MLFDEKRFLLTIKSSVRYIVVTISFDVLSEIIIFGMAWGAKFVSLHSVFATLVFTQFIRIMSDNYFFNIDSGIYF